MNVRDSNVVELAYRGLVQELQWGLFSGLSLQWKRHYYEDQDAREAVAVLLTLFGRRLWD